MNRDSETYGHQPEYQHMHNGSLTRGRERKRGRKKILRDNICKTSTQEIEQDTNKWEGLPYSWIVIVNPQQSTDSVQSLSKYQWHFSQKQNRQS